MFFFDTGFFMLLPQPDFSMSFLGHIDSDMETKNFRRFSTGRNGETNQFKGNVEKKPKLFNNQSFTSAILDVSPNPRSLLIEQKKSRHFWTSN